MNRDVVLYDRNLVEQFFDWTCQQKHSFNSNSQSIFTRWMDIEYLFAIATYLTSKNGKCTVLDLVELAKENPMQVLELLVTEEPSLIILDNAQMLVPFQRQNEDWIMTLLSGCQVLMVSLYYSIWEMKGKMNNEGMNKSFKGKAIYNPSGKAGEYSRWACNFFVGCSNDCTYCYCKKGHLGRIWTDKPQLKKCFKDDEDAFRIFTSELDRNVTELRKDGIFFNFTSDPMLAEARPLTYRSVDYALGKGVPVQILTKRAEFAHDIRWQQLDPGKRKMIAFGFTLTGRDDLEPGASSNRERMDAMQMLHDMGYLTFASIEPVIDPMVSLECIRLTADCCDLFKVGLMSGKKDYTESDVWTLFENIREIQKMHGCRFYLKNSLVKYLHLERTALDNGFVNANYNLFR